MTMYTLALMVAAPLVLVSPAAAQPQDVRPAPTAELSAGYAGFLDDATVAHAAFGGGIRFHLTPRVSVGPEVQYMIGPGSDRDLIVTGNVIFDVRRPGARVTPFLVVGAGAFRHTERFGAAAFSSTEGAFTAGAGVRAWLNDRVYLASEARVGWEPHYRISGSVGIALR
jgi:hypothetical protein